MSAYFIGSVITISGGLTIFISNILLYRSVRRQCEGIAKTIIDSSLQVQNKKRDSVRKRKLKSLKTCICITASYLLTWFPLITLISLQFLLNFSIDWQFILFNFGVTNGFWDVLIYFYLNQRARKRLFHLLSIRKNVIVNSYHDSTAVEPT